MLPLRRDPLDDLPRESADVLEAAGQTVLPFPDSSDHVRRRLLRGGPDVDLAAVDLADANPRAPGDSLGANARDLRGGGHRNLRGETGKTFPVITTGQVIDLTTRSLRAHCGELKSAVKQVADLAESTPRAAENWFLGRNAPDAAHLLTLGRRIPAVRRELYRLLDPDYEGGPERAISEAIDLLQRANLSQRAGR